MTSILITQCLQNDFVKSLEKSEPLPNLLHIGHDESDRLLGRNGVDGPLQRFMHWVQSEANLKTIHIRDWHDPHNPHQASHLKQFGPHCLQNTTGANFVFELPEQNTDSAVFIDSTTLNDFEETHLADILAEHSSETVRVGLIGVWTEAKILFLSYELSTRYPQFDIAVCSALTASSSRSQHFLALQQLERIIGVTVMDSVGEFVEFLGGKQTTIPKQSFSNNLKIEFLGEASLKDDDEYLIRYLFRDCQSVTLKILDGGFSGNLVAGTKSFDVHGHEQAPHVIKIGPRNLMAKERTAFEQIETVLGNNAPAIAEFADLKERGAIKYRYASMVPGGTRTLQWCFQNNVSLETTKKYLDAVFAEQLGRLYHAAVNDTQDLLAYYEFDSKWANSVRQKIEQLIGGCAEKGALMLPGNQPAKNLYQFYNEELEKFSTMVGDYPFSFIHGDLNGANVMIDANHNVWLIDFFHTHKGHVLKDFAKLENDLLYIYTPIDSEDDLKLAYRFSEFVVSMESPLGSLPELPECFNGTQFVRCYQILKNIRALARKYIDPDMPHIRRQWVLPQLRYAVHTIGFDEPNKKQRVWALYSATCLAAVLD